MKTAAIPRQESAAAFESTLYFHPNSAAAQRSRLLQALRRGPISTIDARRDLDVLHPAMRVLELRRQGHLIVTHWVDALTDCGRVHRVARYVLMSTSGMPDAIAGVVE